MKKLMGHEINPNTHQAPHWLIEAKQEKILWESFLISDTQDNVFGKPACKTT